MSEIRARSRETVYSRDWWSCVRCGHVLPAGRRQVQHRVPRGMGGRLGHDRLAALVLLCGTSSTDPAGCHHWAETYRIEAQVCGLLVPEGEDPLTWPVRYSLTHGGGWWTLDDEGDRVRVG